MDLELSGATVRFRQPDGSTLEVLTEVDLTISGGEVVAILGRSGSGKSTLLNVLGLLNPLTGGTYRIDGEDVGGLSEARRSQLRGQRFGFVFQDHVLLDRRTALENVALPLLTAGRDRYRARLATAADCLERVGLADRMRSYPWQLSGGQRQRVAVARALVHRPSMVFADEPTGSLDLDTGAEVLQLMLDLVGSAGAGLVLVTHDDRLAAMASRELFLDHGRFADRRAGSATAPR
jgi:putative ABC transport system ATP-binding protein